MHVSKTIAVLFSTVALVWATPTPLEAKASHHHVNITFGGYATAACLMDFGPVNPPTATLELIRGHCVESPYTFYSYWVYGNEEAWNKTCELKMFEDARCKGDFAEVLVPSYFIGCVIPTEFLAGNSVKMVCG